MAKRRHACDLEKCYKIIDGNLVNVCGDCAVGAMTEVLGHAPRSASTALEKPALDLQTQLKRLMAKAGWEITSLEIDVPAEKCRMELKRGNRVVTFDSTFGRGSTLTREVVESREVAVGRKGDRFRAHRLNTVFLGRDKIPGGLRSGLRHLSRYLADNGSGDRLVAKEALRLLLDPGALGYTPSSKAKACTSDLVAEEMHAFKKGKFVSRAQAIAVGLSRARREC
jgi:hypothetical protein